MKGSFLYLDHLNVQWPCMDWIQAFDLSSSDWFWYALSALFIGMAKAGVKGMGIIAIPTTALVFGAKASIGILVPVLIMADILATWYYKKDADWGYLIRLIPPAIVGLLIGVFVGKGLSEALFQKSLAIIILGSLLLLIYQERRPFPVEKLKNPFISGATGLLGGFTTMIGNAAGAVMSVYFLSTRLPKIQFIGTTAWFFLIINVLKIPFHLFSWHTITAQTFKLNLVIFPFILAGFIIGIKIISLIPEKAFRYFIMTVTGLASLRLLF